MLRTGGPALESLERRVIGPGSARFHIADVPCLQDSSTVGGLRELDGAIVMDLGNRARTVEPCSFELTAGVCADHHFVSWTVGVVAPLGVFSFVVLEDAMLLPFLDVLPVCLERYVEEGISTKH